MRRLLCLLNFHDWRPAFYQGNGWKRPLNIQWCSRCGRTRRVERMIDQTQNDEAGA